MTKEFKPTTNKAIRKAVGTLGVAGNVLLKAGMQEMPEIQARLLQFQHDITELSNALIEYWQGDWQLEEDK